MNSNSNDNEVGEELKVNLKDCVVTVEIVYAV